MDEEFAHEGDEGFFLGFAFGQETLVEGAQDGIAAGTDEGCHVEGFAEEEASAVDAGLSLP